MNEESHLNLCCALTTIFSFCLHGNARTISRTIAKRFKMPGSHMLLGLVSSLPIPQHSRSLIIQRIPSEQMPSRSLINHYSKNIQRSDAFKEHHKSLLKEYPANRCSLDRRCFLGRLVTEQCRKIQEASSLKEYPPYSLSLAKPLAVFKHSGKDQPKRNHYSKNTRRTDAAWVVDASWAG